MEFIKSSGELILTMADQDAGDLLEQCVKLLETASRSSQPTEAQQLIYCNNRGQSQEDAVSPL